MPFDYRNSQQKSRRYKSGKGHKKQSNYHVKGKQSIHQKNKYSILRRTKRTHQRTYNYNNRHLRYCENDENDVCQDTIQWHHCNMTKSSIANKLKHEFPDYIKNRISKELDFNVDDHCIDFKISFTKMQQNKRKQKKRPPKRKKKHLKSSNTTKIETHERINQIEKYNFENNLMILINTVGENVFFDIICKQFLYPWQIVNLSCLCKKINCVIKSYDKNHLFFKHLFSDRDIMIQYISSIMKTTERFENEEFVAVCMFPQLIIRCRATIIHTYPIIYHSATTLAIIL